MDIINTYKYPETNCWECTKNSTPISIQEQDLLLSQLNCKDFNFNCNNYEIKKNTEPLQYNYDTRILNKNNDKLNYSSSYHKIKNNYNGYNYDTYINKDPRLKHGMRTGHILELDKPPINSFINSKDIYNNNLENYGQKYNNISDINAGDIIYYDNNLIKKKSFYTPIFDTKTTNNYNIYKDPMDNISIQNTRNALQNHNPMSIKEFKNKNINLSFISDTEEHRQDLLSLQYLNTIDKNSRTRR